MNTKNLMISSSLVTGVAGVIASFLPKEILANIGQPPAEFSILLIQVAGALYLGFAMMNWMAKTVLIGGIYARPLAMGNFVHFAISAIVIIKATLNNGSLKFLWIPAIIYSLFALLFGVVLFSSPGKVRSSTI